MTDTSHQRAPSLRLLAGEAASMPRWVAARLASRPRPARRPSAGEHLPVLVLPGFLANDAGSRPLRRALERAGWPVFGWGLGINRGASPDTLEAVAARIDSLLARTGAERVHLVGWSLGGLFAREFAKHHPQRIASVISLGSPFSGSLKANHAWRLYQRVAGHPVEAPPIGWHNQARPDVPTYALYSERDGVVAASTSRGEPTESDRAIAVDCTHIGFAYAPASAEAVIACLREVEEGRTGR